MQIFGDENGRKNAKYLHMSKKSSTFAAVFSAGAFGHSKKTQHAQV